MSESLKAKIARRPLLAGALAFLGIAAAGGAAYEAGLFAPSYPTTPYDDLLRLLPNRGDAAIAGEAVLAGNASFDANAAAAALRAKIGKRPLAAVLEADAADGALTEVRGWVMPATLAELSALAASAA